MKTAILLIVFLSSVLFARMSCSTNSFGVTVCTDDKGYRSESRTNSFGVTTTTGNDGYRQSCRTNSFGTTICD